MMKIVSVSLGENYPHQFFQSLILWTRVILTDLSQFSRPIEHLNIIIILAEQDNLKQKR